MSTTLLVTSSQEDRLIDMYRPGVSATSPTVSQADNVGEDRANYGGVKAAELPDPAVGGQNGVRLNNGFSTGFRGLFSRQQPFTGAVAKPQAISNPVVGEVGTSNRGNRQYVGVMDQATQYSANALDTAIKLVAPGL